MRGILVGAVLSVFLWTILTWCVVCAGTWFDGDRMTSSFDALAFSAACIAGALLTAAILAVSIALADEEDAALLKPVQID